MRVVFLENVPNVATVGDIKVVKDGYGRNYLLPRGLAAPATPGILKQIEEMNKAQERKQSRVSGQAAGLAAKLEGMVVSIIPRSGPDGRLYGAITNAHIADELAAATGSPIDHRHVILPDPIKRNGAYQVSVRLTGEHTAKVNVLVGEGVELPASFTEQPEAIVEAAEAVAEVTTPEAAPEHAAEAEADEVVADAEAPKADSETPKAT